MCQVAPSPEKVFHNAALPLHDIRCGAFIHSMKEETANFKNGDIVRLKSGGPDMTVIVDDSALAVMVAEMSKKNWVNCEWFDGKMRRQAEFPPAALNQVSK